MTNYMPLLLASAATIGFMVLFLVLRGIWDLGRSWRAKRRERYEEQESGALIAGLVSEPADDWANRMDRGFEEMVQGTSLGLTVQQALGFIALTGAAVAAAILVWQENLLAAGLGTLAGMGVVLAVFLALRHRWRNRLQEQLPDTFFLLARSMRAGLNLEQALATVAERGNQPIADEFKRCVERTKLGMKVTDALQHMGERLRLPDFNVLVTFINVHREMGGNLPLLLDRIANHTRDRNHYRGYFRASTALGRTTAFCISLASPILLLVYWMLQPQYLIKFAQSPSGFTALCVAGVLEIVGVAWLLYLLRVDY